MVVTEDWTFRAEDVSKVYDGGNRANDGITMRVEPGEVYGLLGPNGAGKSTLVKQVIGLLKPTEGRITLGPYDLVAEPDAARQLCSYLPQAQMPIDSFPSAPPMIRWSYVLVSVVVVLTPSCASACGSAPSYSAG